MNQITRLDRQSLQYQRTDPTARERMDRRKRSYTLRSSTADNAGPAAHGLCGHRECPHDREARGRCRVPRPIEIAGRAGHRHRALSTKCSSAPPANRFRFRSVIGTALPEKVCDRFQFSSRASKKIRRRFAGCWKSGNSTLADTRRFCESHRISESKLIASPPML